MAELQYIERIAIVGATGRIGRHFTEYLLQNGKHTITAITRSDSRGSLPAGVKTLAVDYDDPEVLKSAFQGQHFVIIALSIHAPADLEGKIITAAAKAGVQYIMPNSFGIDTLDQRLVADLPRLQAIPRHCAEIQALGCSFVVLVCGFWFDWSLALGEVTFGFNLKDKKVTFFDDGKTAIDISTWKQCGRAVAGLLRLPVSGKSPALEDWRDKALCIQSFRISQREMLDSIHRVTGSTDADWEIRYESTKQRYEDGKEKLEEGGDVMAWAKMLYSRSFYPVEDGAVEKRSANEALGLREEDLDELMKELLIAVEGGWSPLTA